MCFSEAFYDTPVKNIPPRKQHMDDTHMVPASSGELPQLQDITGTWQPRSGRAHTLPVPSSLQVPSVSLTSNFTFFLGRILGQLPKHILCIVSASCCHHKGTWDGWRWGPTTEQIQVPGISQWTCSQCRAHRQKQGKKPPREPELLGEGVEMVPPAHTVHWSHPIKCHSLHGLFWMLHQVHSGVKV